MSSSIIDPSSFIIWEHYALVFADGTTGVRQRTVCFDVTTPEVKIKLFFGFFRYLHA